MDGLLYYPYINIPKSDWTARAMLYYESVACIVPQRYFYNPGDYETSMRELVEQELIIPINPMEQLDNPWEVSRPFIEYINGNKLKLRQRRKNFGNRTLYKINSNRFVSNPVKIHSDKFDNEVFYQLEQAGLAVREDHEWYYVEKTTANELMKFLASVLGDVMNYLPATDEIKRRFPVYDKSRNIFDSHKNSQENKREIILARLIPFPENVDLKKLRKFKDNHLDLLNAFRNKVELIALDPNISETSELFEEKINELNIRKQELSAKMSESHLGKIFFGTICGSAGAVYGFSNAGTRGAVLGALPGLASAIYSAVKIERPEDIFDQSGLK